MKDFLNQPHNSVTRERIFFNRLCFDLKIAAARRGYPLTLFEPEVDRDGFDLIIDDADNNRHFQLKTVLKTSKTPSWNINKRILRPNILMGNKCNLAPEDCGVGGGVILISIDVSQNEPLIQYYYTDYLIIMSFHMRMFLERSRKKAQKTRYQRAELFLSEIHNGSHKDKIEINKKLFLKTQSADCLLAIAGFHSTENCYLPGDNILKVHTRRFEADMNGISHTDQATASMAHTCASDIYGLLDEPELRPFTFP